MEKGANLLMPRFAANLSMLFAEYPMEQRIDQAASAGFKAVELAYPYDTGTAPILEAIDRTGVTIVQFNLRAGNFAAGDRGFANDPRRTSEFREGVQEALGIAQAIGVKQLNCLVGKSLEDVPVHDQWTALQENMSYAAEEGSKVGILQMVEPVNTIDVPGYVLCSPHRGFAFLDEVAHPNLKVQYDLYHAQRMEGNLISTIRDHIGQIGHIQVADSPDRHEPGTGELNYPFLLSAIEDAGYAGWISLEYNPATTTVEGLSWITDMGFSV
jgi:hydroxypyruvate isomerase